ncbi:integrase, catalytic region (plasmid) [Cylindrospermum sp. NIES-4074]|nr:integrase, catalytic region [Cylindrospermum sp. NIES-4074]
MNTLTRSTPRHGDRPLSIVHIDHTQLDIELRCIKKTRPAAKPRFGSVIERLFGVTNTEFVHNLLGNTQASKQPRQLTKAIDPKRQAVWTLGELYTYLMEWAYTIYDQDEHPALGMTPREAYLSGLSRTGEREHLYISYSEEFLMATLPSTKKGLALVQPGKGIKINYLYYWSDAFRHPEVERTQVPVRYDPFDIGVAYAYLQGRWVKCISQYYSIFQGRSEKELSLASLEIRQHSKLTSSSTSVSTKRLADFLSNVQTHEALLLQRLRDLEGLQVREVAAKEEEMPVAQLVTAKVQTQGSSEQMPQLSNSVTPIDLAVLPIFEEYR